jgi:hypothetical protein
MSNKRKPTLKQIFNAWLKYQKKSEDTYKAKVYAEKLANQVDPYATELLEHEGTVYRISITGNRWGQSYDVKEIAKASELP